MGRYSDPNSRRSLAAAAKAARIAVIDNPAPAASKLSSVPDAGSALPVPPEWLTERQTKLFLAVRAEQVAAGVPVKRIDGHMITLFAIGLDESRELTEMSVDPDASPEVRIKAIQLRGQCRRDLIQMAPLLGACQLGRTRIGLKTEQPKKQGAMAQLLAARQAKRA